MRTSPGVIRLSGHILTTAGPAAIEYSIRCDGAWRTREVRIADTLTGRAVHLLADGAGAWTTDRGDELTELAGAVDPDIAATPMTNTLPIRRLAPAVGESVEILTAYVAVPDLTVSPGPQRYTRLGERLYRFEALDRGFVCDIAVDRHGFVEDYPGLFARLAPAL